MQDFLEFLENYRSEQERGNRISFHMPGHKGGAIYKKYGYSKLLEGAMAFDITEIAGADNLHAPEGIIADLEKRYEDLYGAKKSFISINGSSAGIMAAILTSIYMAQEQKAEGQKNEEQKRCKSPKLLISRASHKSVYSILELAGIEPAYLQPIYLEGCDIIGEVRASDIERVLKKDESIGAVLVTSPNYYGICSDIKEISKVVHKYGKILIVDQAHGAHLKFFSLYQDVLQLPPSAEDSGADIVINSIHKTLASFTQTAVINIMSERIDVSLFREKLNLLQSTSPSYILMASLAINARLIEEQGKELFTDWAENIKDFYGELNETLCEKKSGIKILDDKRLDKTKINLDLAASDISGKELDKELCEKGIYTELFTGDILMAMSGIGNKKSDYDKLLDAIAEIAKKIEKPKKSNNSNKSKEPKKAEVAIDKNHIKLVIPKKAEVCDKEYKIKKQFLELSDCEGMISAASVIPYPPGIPILCPGELIESEAIEAIKKCLDEGIKIVGIKEGKAIRVYKCE